MKLKLSICSECSLNISVNGKSNIYHSNGVFEFSDLPEQTVIHVKQIQFRRKWYLFPIYILEGILTLLVYYQSEYSATDFLRPYIYECLFKIDTNDVSSISIDSVDSKVKDNCRCSHGYIMVQGEGIFNIKHIECKNDYSFRTTLIKTCFAFLWSPVLLLLLFAFFAFNTPNASIIGKIIIGVVFLLLLAFAIYKVICEKKKLQYIRTNIYK